MKTCFKCLRTLPIEEFYRHPLMADGHLGKCKSCTRHDVSDRYYAAHPDRVAYERKRAKTEARREKAVKYQRAARRKNPNKSRARAAVAYALSTGKIQRSPCAHCGATERVQAHHEDYNKPLEVMWLCFRCHREHAHHQRLAA